MKSAFVILSSILLLIDPTAISKINSAKSEAKKAFNDGKYKEAIQKYRYLIDKLGVTEDEVKMNLANAYYLENDTTNAKPLYRELTQSIKNEIRSNAFQQLGIMMNKQGKSEEALNQFKQAIKADPTNQDARFNYEMLKKKLEEQKKKDQQKQDQNKDQKDQKNKDQQNKDDNKKDQKDKKDEKKDQQNKDQKDKEKKDQEKKDQEKKDQEKEDQEKKDQKKKDQQEEEKKNEQKKDQKDQLQNQEQKDEQQKKDDKKVPQQVADKLKQMNISEEKAKMILEAMKNQEVQYLQQNKRRASKPRDRGKPDW